MNVAFRPPLPRDFDYCERLYFAEMERINRDLKLDGICKSRASGAGGRDAGADHYARRRRHRLAAKHDTRERLVPRAVLCGRTFPAARHRLSKNTGPKFRHP